jgi:hypothetical protein
LSGSRTFPLPLDLEFAPQIKQICFSYLQKVLLLNIVRTCILKICGDLEIESDSSKRKGKPLLKVCLGRGRRKNGRQPAAGKGFGRRAPHETAGYCPECSEKGIS